VTTNGLKDRWAQGDVAVGAWCMAGAPYIAEMFAMSGFHYVCLDQQHGLIGYDGLLSSLYAVARTDATPITRVVANDGGLIGKALDAGAEGVIVPMVNLPEEAERAVSACRYYPEGHRSFGSVRGGYTFGTDPAVVNRQVACIVMIETAMGVSHAVDICAVPGVDAVYIGPADLAISLGCSPGLGIQPGVHAEAIQSVLDACLGHGVTAGIHCGSAEQGAQCSEMGFGMITVATDIALIRAAAAREFDHAIGSVNRGGRGQQS